MNNCFRLRRNKVHHCMLSHIDCILVWNVKLYFSERRPMWKWRTCILLFGQQGPPKLVAKRQKKILAVITSRVLSSHCHKLLKVYYLLVSPVRIFQPIGCIVLIFWFYVETIIKLWTRKVQSTTVVSSPTDGQVLMWHSHLPITAYLWPRPHNQIRNS